MTATDLRGFAGPDRRDGIARWRRRSRFMRVLRIALPALIGLIVLGMAGAVIYNSITAEPLNQRDPNAPIRLVNPRFVGRDDKGRAFVLTAVSATRDPREYQRVLLDRPALVLDEEGPDPLRITAHDGIYNEQDRQLEVRGGVRLSGAKGAFETAHSIFDTKTGELVGSGPIQGSGALGEINAQSYSVQGKGAEILFKGGVHTRLDMK